MPYKLYNPDPADLNVTVNDVKVSLPAKSYAIVQALGDIQELYPSLEVTEASDKDYTEYRASLVKLQKAAEAAAKEAAEKAADEAKKEAKLSAAKIKKQRETADEEAAKALEV